MPYQFRISNERLFLWRALHKYTIVAAGEPGLLVTDELEIMHRWDYHNPKGSVDCSGSHWRSPAPAAPGSAVTTADTGADGGAYKVDRSLIVRVP